MTCDPDTSEILGVEKEIEDEVSKGLKILSKNKIPTARMSEDSEVNSHGKCLIDICRNSDLFILNSRLGKDLNICRARCNDVSVVDLVISAPEIFPIVKEYELFNFNPFLSDVYCPFSLSLKSFNSNKQGSSFNCKDIYRRHMSGGRWVWEEIKKMDFVN